MWRIILNASLFANMQCDFCFWIGAVNALISYPCLTFIIIIIIIIIIRVPWNAGRSWVAAPLMAPQ
jgi:hypothetical protein